MQGWNERPHECRGHALSKDGRRHEKKTAEKKKSLDTYHVRVCSEP